MKLFFSVGFRRSGAGEYFYVFEKQPNAKKKSNR
jgi:hypothetical protein